MKHLVTCSWCHEQSEPSLVGRKIFCWSCGHRPDLPQSECDCPRCRRRSAPREEVKRKAAAA